MKALLRRHLALAAAPDLVLPRLRAISAGEGDVVAGLAGIPTIRTAWAGFQVSARTARQAQDRHNGAGRPRRRGRGGG